jgi:membrane-bound serine protease (ClpP class)
MHRRPHRDAWVNRLVLAVVFLLSVSQAHAQSPVVVHLDLHDTVQPVSAQYLARGLATAAQDHAALVILSLDTPGGLLTSTREMVSSIENSPVPVAVFVSPGGARAGSAGFFLLEAADIAAMAPTTNAGASHPIVTGASSATMDPLLKQKIENDAAAFLRSFVEPRGRNVTAAEDAVRNSKSYSADECLKLHLIDRIAPNDTALIAALNGQTIKRFDGRPQTLVLTNATTLVITPSTREQLLTRLTDPDFAILLLFAGVLLIYLEFNAPGTIIPGSLGALFVLLGLFGLDYLPLRHASVALMVAGLILMLLELKVPSHGILAIAGTLAIVCGLLTLVDTSTGAPRVHPAVAAATGAAFGLISTLLAWLALRARRNKTLLGPDALVGRLGIARTAILSHGETPIGQVEVRGELWQATLTAAITLPAGAPVLVQAVEGLMLRVAPASEPFAAPTPIATASAPSNR